MGLGSAVGQIVSESVACPGSSRKQWETVVGKATRACGIEACCWLSVGPREQDRVQVGKFKIWRSRVVYRRVGLESKGDIEFVDPVDIV